MNKLTPTVFVILPVFNRQRITLEFVKQLKQQTYVPIELLLVDDGSVDETSKAVREVYSDVTIIKGNGNLWWAGSLHRSFQQLKRNISTSGFILIMNDDVSIAQDFVEKGVRIINELPERSILVAIGDDIAGSERKDSGGYYFDWERFAFNETYDLNKINCASTRGLLIPLNIFKESKGFYPKLIPHYLSDLEFTMRLQERGVNIFSEPSFRLRINFETTGIHEFKSYPFFKFLKYYFSKKHSGNPISWTFFVILRCPWKFKIKNIWKIWQNVKLSVYDMRIKVAIKNRLKWGRS